MPNKTNVKHTVYHRKTTPIGYRVKRLFKSIGNSLITPKKPYACMTAKAIAAVIALMLFLLSHISYAGKKGVLVYVNTPFIEFRPGPGRGYPIIHVVEKGDPLRLIMKRTDWYKVLDEKTGKTGWVQRKSLHNTLTEDGDLADFSLSRWQQYLDKKIETGIMGGQFGGTNAVNTYLGWHITRNIALEANYTQNFSNIGSNRLYSARILHQAFPSWYVSPFFVLGSGLIIISPNANDVQVRDRDESVMTVGGGFRIFSGRRFLIRLEYNQHTLLTKRELNEEVDEWKLGFGAFF